MVGMLDSFANHVDSLRTNEVRHLAVATLLCVCYIDVKLGCSCEKDGRVVSYTRLSCGHRRILSQNG